MTELLVSARDFAEAQLARDAGADIVDLKEPMQGAMGRVSRDFALNIAQALGTSVPLSLAFGELSDVELDPLSL
ncbi:MAG TPA: (5-formylfuran-3-yl)methyl phosphate synthase, partial [Pirellulaceae bacterium]